jgi:hypothetical protein
MKRFAHTALISLLAALTSACWSAQVELADLDGATSTLDTGGQTDDETESGGGTQSDTNPGTEPDTNPCDWQVEHPGKIATVFGFASDAIYIGGKKNDETVLLSYFNAETWTDMASDVGLGWTTLIVNSIHGSSATDVIAVGGVPDLLGGIARWSGAAWQPEIVTAPPLRAVWSNATDDAYTAAPGVVLHYDGEQWSRVDIMVFANLILEAFWGLDSYDMWAVGGPATSGQGVVVHYDGVSWKPTPIPEPSPLPALTDIWGSAPNDVYVVGGYGTIVHFDGNAWRAQELPGSAEAIHLSAVWGRNAQEIYAGGKDAQGEGILFTRISGAWTVYDDGLPDPPAQLWAPPPDGPLFVASDKGLLVCR